MKQLWFSTLLSAAVLLGGQSRQAEVNVNERYTVEAVEVSGVDESRISKGLREDLQKLVGEKFSQRKVYELIKRLGQEFPGRTVIQKMRRGLAPEHVKLILVVARETNLDAVTASRALYHSRQGWTGELGISTHAYEANRFSFGVLSNADDLLERFTGIKAGYERTRLGTDHARLAFRFESYHQIWNRSTLMALEALEGRARDLPHAAEFRAGPHLGAGEAVEADRGDEFPALPNPVSGRANRSRQRRSNHSAL